MEVKKTEQTLTAHTWRTEKVDPGKLMEQDGLFEPESRRYNISQKSGIY